jgi:hypothetical protein
VPHWLALFSFSVGQGGLGVVLSGVVGGVALRGSALSQDKASFVLHTLLLLVSASVLAELVLTTWYLFVPGFMDHIEASVASNVHYFRAGLPLYPAPDAYTFHGLVYGPLLYEVNSLGYLIVAGALSAKIIGWLAAWIAIPLMLLTSPAGERGWRRYLGAAYALCFLVSFGGELTTDRSESLLLLCSLVALIVSLSSRGASGLFALGILCGASCALKLHGVLYCFPAVILWSSRYPAAAWLRNWAVVGTGFAAFAAAGAALPFIPPNVSLSAYVNYLELALKHGVSLELFARTCAFFLGIWAPIIILVGSGSTARRMPLELRSFAIALLVAEGLVVIVASKPGAGVHHLLPFLPFHAYLFQRLYVELGSLHEESKALQSKLIAAIAASVIGITWPTLHTYGELLRFDLDSHEQALQRDELLRLAGQYRGGMVGVTDDTSYQLTNLRPWLTLHGALQTDYGAFMDLRLSGLDDRPLQAALDTCRIPYIYMPKLGLPFTLRSNYTGLPLFSEDLRRVFSARYSPVAQGNYFDVYGCAGPHSQL